MGHDLVSGDLRRAGARGRLGTLYRYGLYQVAREFNGLMKAQEEERVRIAGELHDGVLQQITSLTLELFTVALELPPDSEPKAEIRELQNR